ncbi:MAG: hypothetical protein KBC73_02415 [Burkholderiaceae bacterium]|nr:hypothetical protein [Burkholderiaceae bacterium]
MLVVHLTHTPLAGAPIRICQALQLHPGIESRVCVLNAAAFGSRTFDEDLVWQRDKDEVIDLVQRCDVLHLHNYIDLDSQEFAPIDFRRLWQQGKPMVRQFHAGPALVARFMGRSEAQVLDCPIPKLVCGQWQERCYPNARPVPLIVFPPEPAPRPSARDGVRISYAPSLFRPARAERWDTKGYPETRRMLDQVQKRARAEGHAVTVDVIEMVPHQECLARKALSHVAIDELVTGSYHTSTLESLAAGSATMVYLDDRTRASFMRLSGQYELPVLSVPLEHAATMLGALVRDPELVDALGQHSARWMREHWHPRDMVRHFLAAYEQVRADPHRPFETRFDGQGLEGWLSRGRYDLMWQSRSALWPKEPPAWLLAGRGLAGRLLRSVGLRR